MIPEEEKDSYSTRYWAASELGQLADCRLQQSLALYIDMTFAIEYRADDLALV